jgi:hypothetical protein
MCCHQYSRHGFFYFSGFYFYPRKRIGCPALGEDG